MTRSTCVALLIAGLAAGCSEHTIVPVSGTITVNNKPYKDLVITFQPMGDEKNPNAGRGSAGVTDADGRFTLIYDGTRPGAVVGRHRVRIFTKHGAEPPPEGAGEEAPSRKGKSFVETIPAEWHEQSDKEFEVPKKGTGQADFKITTAAPKP